jgi:uroporphyrinogen-III synthase
MKILVTRPRADAEDLAKLLAGRGHELLLEPLLDISPIAGEPIAANETQAVLFTSANGVRALVARNGGDISALRHLPVYSVGDATGRAAREAGFNEVVSASGDVKALAALVATRVRPDAGPLLHVAASDVAGDLAGLLGTQGFTVTRAVLYEAKKAEALSPEAAGALRRGEIPAALFFSPRTATAFVALAAAADLAPALGRTTAICLSPAVADAIDELPGAASWRDILTAAEPTQDSLLSALDRFVERETRPKTSLSDAPAKAPSSPQASPWTMGAAAAETTTEAPVDAPIDARASPLPPPIFSDSHASGASAPQSVSQSVPASDRASWQSRVALAVVALLLIGGVALYLAKPAALQRFLAFEWFSLPTSTSTLTPQSVPVESLAQLPDAPRDGASAESPVNPGDSAAVIDALRRELSLTTARLMEAQREPPIRRPYEAPPEAPAEPEASPELLSRLDDLESRLGRLADRPGATETLRYATDAFSARITRLDETLSALTQKLESQTVAQEAERARAARAETLALSALALRESLDAGTPFAEALDGLRPLAQEMGLGNAADLVAPAAAKGLAGLDDLRGRLMALVGEVMRAEAGRPDSGLFAKLWRSLSSAVVVRRVADDAAILNAGDPADRLLSRAERRLAAGDLDEAIAPVELLATRDSITPPLRQALEDWLVDARARRAAETLAAALLQRGLAGRRSAPQ